MNSQPRFPAFAFLLAASLLVCAASLRAQTPTIVTGADSGGTVTVNTYAPNGTNTGSFFGGPAAYTGGLRVGTGDIAGGGSNDIITGEGSGGSTVRVYTGAAHTLTASFTPFGATYTSGVYVAGGDIDKDGHADIITSTGNGNLPQVKIFSGVNTSVVLGNFFAFDTSFTGGVTVASGDVNHDGFADIIAGTASGAGSVRVYSGKDFSLLQSFVAFAGYTGGVNVGAGDVNHDGFADIIVGTATGVGQVKVFSGSDPSTVLKNFNAFASGTGGARVAEADLNGDGFADIVAGQGPGGTSLVTAFDGQTTLALSSFQPYGPNANGVFVGAVPEPRTWVLLIFAAAVGGWRASRRRARNESI